MFNLLSKKLEENWGKCQFKKVFWRRWIFDLQSIMEDLKAEKRIEKSLITFF